MNHDQVEDYHVISDWAAFKPGAVILIREQKDGVRVERPAIVIKSFPSKIDILKFTTTPNEKFDFFKFKWNDKLQSCRLIYADTLKSTDFQANRIVLTDYQFSPAIRQKIFGYLRLYQLCVEQKINFNQIRLNYDRIMNFIKDRDPSRERTERK